MKIRHVGFLILLWGIGTVVYYFVAITGTTTSSSTGGRNLLFEHRKKDYNLNFLHRNGKRIRRRGTSSSIPESNSNTTSNSLLSTETSRSPPPPPRSPPRSSSPYAYAFLIGRVVYIDDDDNDNIDEDNTNNDNKYKPYIYSVMVATYILRQHGSTADVILYVDEILYQQNTHLFNIFYKINNANNAKNTNAKEGKIIIRTIPTQHSFEQLQYQKFRILNETQYQRILYMDSDLIPTTNLDYIFVASTKGIIHENFVVQGKYSPVNGGFFMLTPSVNDYEYVQKLIREKEEETEDESFDIRIGWDNYGRIGLWKGSLEKGYDWTFNAASSDQGLLYYYTKYYFNGGAKKRNNNNNHSTNGGRGVSIQMLTTIKHYTTEGNTTSTSTSSLSSSLFDDQPAHCFGMICDGVWGHFVHFYGSHKPWYVAYPFRSSSNNDAKSNSNNNNNNNNADGGSSNNETKTKTNNGHHFHHLSTFRERVDMAKAVKLADISRKNNNNKTQPGDSTSSSNNNNRNAGGEDANKMTEKQLQQEQDQPKPLKHGDDDEEKYKSEIHYWFAMLDEINDKYNAGIDVHNILIKRKPGMRKKKNMNKNPSIGVGGGQSNVQRPPPYTPKLQQ